LPPAIGVDSTPSSSYGGPTRNMNSLTTVGARVIDSGLVRCNPSRRRKVGGGMRRSINPPSPQISIRHNIASVVNLSDEDRDDCEQRDECGDDYHDSPPPTWPVSRRRHQTPSYKSSLRENRRWILHLLDYDNLRHLPPPIVRVEILPEYSLYYVTCQ
jgi:hypothetical protein